MIAAAPDPAIDNAAATYFGINRLRPEQRRLIAAAMAGGNILGVLPTGFGKSLCYQLPAVMGQGLSVVISPLLALMRDQLVALDARGIGAVMISSLDDDEARFEKWQRAARGKAKLVYLSPEQFAKSTTQFALGRCDWRRLVVDEAHCFSEWGHDFRPDYRAIPKFLPKSVAISAFTATASQTVINDLRGELFAGRSAEVLVRDAVRDNIAMRFIAKTAPREQLMAAITPEGAVVIYAKTRSKCQVLAQALREVGLDAAHYHAGLEASARAALEGRFLTGRVRILVATNAFGLGIDNPDIRQIIHADMPPSIEAYVQEIGRAGRDGARAEAVCFFDDDDFDWRAEQIEKSVGETGKRAADLSRLRAMRMLCKAADIAGEINRYFRSGNAHIAVQHDASNAGTIGQELRFELLRWRAQLAAQMKIPPFWILPDQIIDKIAINLPNGLDDLAAIPGMGSKRLQKYSADLLRIIAAKNAQHFVPNSARRIALAHGGDGGLYEALRALERRLAQGADGRSLPLNLGEARIIRIVKAKPINRAALARISGMDEKRLARFGDAIIMAVNEAAQKHRG